MHTCISSYGLKRSRRSCTRRVNAGNKNTPSTHHPRRRNANTFMVGLKKRSHTQKSRPKVVNPRDIARESKKKKKKKKKNLPSGEPGGPAAGSAGSAPPSASPWPAGDSAVP